MTETAIFEPGGYRYVRGPFQYSGGVAAEEGYAIERIRFQTPVPLGRRVQADRGASGFHRAPLRGVCRLRASLA